ncbi:hypothetical protein KDL01_04445 [Actinospica durhamensis]|uniref:Uncharacterized protein n=1 Tax=Actinospica durhamensis TaxID=1508375 RepID=A0A941EKE5_9ACTN|nr:hypothetical protein [Actinospica durhamensis]MBR7832493.1 hypothetical protein [Actinospica durhamensis]
MTHELHNENGPRCVTTEDRSEDQLSAGTSPTSMPNAAAPVSARAEDGELRGLYLAAENEGRKLAVDWIGHSATKPIVLYYRWHAVGILDTPPIDRFTVGEHAQGAIHAFTQSALKCFGEHPDGAVDPDVLRDPERGWPLTEAERYAALNLAHAWSSLLAIIANVLRSAGVPIDATYSASAGDRRFRNDLFALAELISLPIDLDADPEYLVGEILNVYAPMAFNAADHQVTIREIRHADSDGTAMALQRRRVERDTGRRTFPTPRKPDPKVYTMAPNWATRLQGLRHEALKTAYGVRSSWGRHRFTPADVRKTWGSTVGTPGGAVSNVLTRLLAGIEDCEGNPRTAEAPSLSTLQRDFKTCGIPLSPGKTRRR